MKGKKNFILASLACLSVFGGGVKAMQRSHSAPRMIVRNDEMVSGKEFNQAMRKASNMGAFGTLFGAAAGAGVSGAITYSFMNKNVKELTDKVDKLTKENEELKKQLDKKDDGHPDAPLGDAEKDAEIKKLKDKNKILLDVCKEYRKTTKEFFKDLKDKTKHIYNDSHMLYAHMWDFKSYDIEKAIDNITKKYSNKELTEDLKDVESKLRERMNEMREYVSKGVEDMKLEELFGEFPRNIDGFMMLTDGIKGTLFFQHHIDLDKDED